MAIWKENNCTERLLQMCLPNIVYKVNRQSIYLGLEKNKEIGFQSSVPERSSLHHL